MPQNGSRTISVSPGRFHSSSVYWLILASDFGISVQNEKPSGVIVIATAHASRITADLRHRRLSTSTWPARPAPSSTNPSNTPPCTLPQMRKTKGSHQSRSRTRRNKIVGMNNSENAWGRGSHQPADETRESPIQKNLSSAGAGQPPRECPSARQSMPRRRASGAGNRPARTGRRKSPRPSHS